jgi:ribosomal protein S2
MRYAVHFEAMEPLRTVGKRPALVIFLHPMDHRVAVREVASMGVPMAGVINSDFPWASKVDYPLVGNDRGGSAHRLYMSRRAMAMKEGRWQRAQNA